MGSLGGDQIDGDLEKNKPKEVKEDEVLNANKPKKSSFFKQYLIDYTANSNLHGLKYIGEDERTFIEKYVYYSKIQ